MGVCLCRSYISGLHSDYDIIPWDPTKRSQFVAHCKLSYYMSLEGMMDFLAFLVPKLWPNFTKLIREIPHILAEIPEIFGFFGTTFEPETLESRSRALKIRIIA